MEEAAVKACGELVKAVKGKKVVFFFGKLPKVSNFPQPKKRRRRRKSHQRKEVPTANQVTLQVTARRKRRRKKNQRKPQRKKGKIVVLQLKFN